MQYQLMKGKSRSNVTFVATAVLKTLKSKNMFNQFMKKKKSKFKYDFKKVLTIVLWRLRG